MPTIGDRLYSIETLEREQGKLEATLNDLRERLTQESSELADRIRAGGTTEDRLLDLVIEAYGVVDHDVVDRCRALEAKLKGKSGEFVVYRFVREEIEKHVFVGEHTYCHKKFFRIGVLLSDRIVFIASMEGCSEKAVLVDVPRYIEMLDTAYYYGEKASRKFSPPHLTRENILALTYNETTPTLPDYLDGRGEPELIVGDEDVRKWLRSIGIGDDEQAAIAAALGKLILRPTD